jgi:RNA polymerase sigma factor (sigma-70 family)
MLLEREEITTIFNENYLSLCRFVKTIIGNGQAQEIAQESFLRLCQAEIADIPSADIRFWLFRVARNLALNELNKGKNQFRFRDKLADFFFKNELTQEEILLRDENYSIVRRLLNKLPEHQRSALILREQEEMSYRDIALVLNISESKVKVDIFRGRKSLRTLWFEEQEKK